MSEYDEVYNVSEAKKWFIPTAAFLARDMYFDAHSTKPMRIMRQRALEQRIDKWRDLTMQIIHQHQQANKKIESLQTQLDNLLCRIHRDGGHYISEHRAEKAFNDADTKVAESYGLIDSLQARVEELEKGINDHIANADEYPSVILRKVLYAKGKSDG